MAVVDTAKDCPSEEQLARWVGPPGDPEGLAAILAHLDACEDCRELAVTLARRSVTAPGGGPDGAPLPPVQAGALVDRYVVLHRVGAGGMGVVFAAYDPVLDRKVALKIVRPQRAATERMAKEARALARVSHPNVVGVHDGGQYGELVYLVMEYVEGRTLRSWLSGVRPSTASILACLRQAGEGVAAVHAAKLVHRDFKPENVMVGRDERVRVTDFGLAQDDAATAGLAELAGTLLYMAPEQLQGERADARSDQYAFAATAYEALFGVHPHRARTRAELVQAARCGRRDRGAAPRRVPRSVVRVLDRAMAFDPACRYPDMRTLLRDLSPRRSPGRAMVGAVGLLLAGGVALGLRHRHTARAELCRDSELRMGEVWDDARRAEVIAAFDGLPAVPYGHAMGQSVVMGLDAFRTEWAKAHTEACEATHLRGEQSEHALEREMACLDARKRELAALVGVLRSPSALVARRAVEAVDSLTDVGACLDARGLERRELGSHAPGVAAADASLAALKGRVDAGALADLLPELEAALAGAKERVDRYAEARADVLLAETKRGTGDAAGAEGTLLEAVFAAEAAGDDEEQAFAWTRLAAIAGLDLAHTAEADRYARHAEALLSHLHAPLLESKLLLARGKIALRAGDYDAAVRSFSGAIAQLVASGKGEGRDAATSRDGLGYALAATGRRAEGRVELLHSIATRERLLGAGHPDTAAGLFDLSRIDLDDGRYRDAEEHLERALGVFRSLGKAETPEVADVINSLGMVAWRAGHADVARARYAEALGMYRRLYGDHPATAITASNLAEVDLDAARYDDAARGYEDALGIWRRAGGTDRDAEAAIRTGLGRAELGQGHDDRARAELTRALEIYASGSFEPGDRAHAQLAMARLVARSEPARSRDLASSARRAFADAGGYPRELAAAEELLAK